eukprot:2135082-Pyramimonas_sp.AAC.1
MICTVLHCSVREGVRHVQPGHHPVPPGPLDDLYCHDTVAAGAVPADPAVHRLCPGGAAKPTRLAGECIARTTWGVCNTELGRAVRICNTELGRTERICNTELGRA